MSDLLAETGLRVAGSHIMVGMFRTSWTSSSATIRPSAASTWASPPCPASLRTIEGFKTVAKLMNTAGQALQDAGLALYYHNHNFEFFDLGGGVRGMDILWNETDPAVATFEIDCYWAVYAGVDPSALIKAHAGRYPLIHLKDMTGEGEARTFAEVGEGVIDWQPVFAASEAQGAEWYIVEQDRCARPTWKAPSSASKTSRAGAKASHSDPRMRANMARIRLTLASCSAADCQRWR